MIAHWKARQNKLAFVLVVEDRVEIQNLIKIALKNASWVGCVHVVGSAEEAMRFLQKKEKYVSADSPDLIICDLYLPGKNGQYILEQIKSSRALMSIPVVMFSDSVEESAIAQAYSGGAEIYLRKPLDIDAFFRMMENLKDFWNKIQTDSKRKRRHRVRQLLHKNQFTELPKARHFFLLIATFVSTF